MTIEELIASLMPHAASSPDGADVEVCLLVPGANGYDQIPLIESRICKFLRKGASADGSVVGIMVDKHQHEDTTQ